MGKGSMFSVKIKWYKESIKCLEYKLSVVSSAHNFILSNIATEVKEPLTIHFLTYTL